MHGPHLHGQGLTPPARQDCPAGTYSSVPGSTSCTQCREGTYGPGVGSPTVFGCLSCPTGTYSARPGAISSSACEPCPAGTYSSDTFAWRCTPCPRGFYSPTPGVSSYAACTKCPNVNGSLDVEATTPSEGAYSVTMCMPCPAGTLPDRSGGCAPCPRGTYFTPPRTCAITPAGTYTDLEASTRPTPCPAGTVSSGLAGAPSMSVGCKAGPANASSAAGATNWMGCPPGKYSSHVLFYDTVERTPCKVRTLNPKPPSRAGSS